MNRKVITLHILSIIYYCIKSSSLGGSEELASPFGSCMGMSTSNLYEEHIRRDRPMTRKSNPPQKNLLGYLSSGINIIPFASRKRELLLALQNHFSGRGRNISRPLCEKKINQVMGILEVELKPLFAN